MNNSIIKVHIGEVKTGHGDQQLHTILGSCIGIALLWPNHGVYGLAHCLLPQTPQGIKTVKSTKKKQKGQVYDGRYVDQAIDSLLRAMNITHFRDIRAVVAGGANMTQPNCKEPAKLVGSLNTANAVSELNERGILIVHKDTGGESGRKMTIHCATGLYDVESIPRPQFSQ